MIFAVQPEAGVSAQPALQPAGNGNQLKVTGPQNISTAAAACQWTYYPVIGGKLQPQKLLYKDPDNTPIVNLSLGNPFKGNSLKGSLTPLANTGSADFDGDNKTDVFRTTPRSDGNLQWQYSSGGGAPGRTWPMPALISRPRCLQFGNFDGDAKTDVFATQYVNGIAKLTSGCIRPAAGQASSPWALPPNYPSLQTLGDFNGDGVTDVFVATERTALPVGLFSRRRGSPGQPGLLQAPICRCCASAISTATARPTSSPPPRQQTAPTNGSTPAGGRPATPTWPPPASPTRSCSSATSTATARPT